jgi:hypothetical protein
MLIHNIIYLEVRHSEPLHPVLATIIAAAFKPREYPPRQNPS